MVKTKWTLQELLDNHPRPWSFAADPGCYTAVQDACGVTIPVPGPALVPMFVRMVNVQEARRAQPPAKPPTFREGMLVCATVDPEDPNTHDVFEVLAITPEGMYCRDPDGLHLPFFADEYDKCRIFPVGHVERGWFGRKRWVYGSGGPPHSPPWPQQSFTATLDNLRKLKTELSILNSTPTDLR